MNMTRHDTILRGVALGAGLVLLLALVAGCEDTPLTAPEDGEIVVSASPASITLDPENNVDEADALITAQVFDETGLPLEGVSVFFSTDAGDMQTTDGDPLDGAVETNVNGVARARVSVGLDDVGVVTVTARSGAADGEVELDVSEIGVNRQPTVAAAPTADPPFTVNGANEDTSNAFVLRTFAAGQTVTVAARASDEACGTGAVFGNQSPALSYTIDDDAPVANAGPDKSANFGSQNSVSVSLTSTSTDTGGTGITTSEWNCDNGSIVTGTSVSCVYDRADGTDVNYQVVLTVTDRCGQSDTDDVVVNLDP
jgi:hypothetical protein